MGEKKFLRERKTWILVNCNIVKFYGSVTLRASLQNEIMAYLHFSEFNSLQSQYHLFYDIIINGYVVWALDRAETNTRIKKNNNAIFQ